MVLAVNSEMDQLAILVGNYVGIPASAARLAIGHVFAFLERRDPAIGEELISKVPGARDAVNDAIATPSMGVFGKSLSGLAKLTGGRQGEVLALASQLTGLGLSNDQLQRLARAVFKLAEIAVGRAKIQTLTDPIPGLSKFLWPRG